MSRISNIAALLKRNGGVPELACYPSLVLGVTAGPADHGAASAYSYDVWVNSPAGGQKYTGVTPTVQRWHDTQDVTPLAPNTMTIMGSVDKEYVGLLTRELAYVTQCSQSRGDVLQGQIAQLIGLIRSMTPAQRAAVKMELSL